MTKLTATIPIVMDLDEDISVSGFEVSRQNSKKVVFDAGFGDKLVFKGKDFEFDGDLNDLDNKVTGGTLEEIFSKTSGGDKLVEISDLDVPAKKIFSKFFDGDTEGFYKNLFKGDDKLKGSEFDDVIYGFKGDDKVVGKAGDDLLYGGKDDDKVIGKAGDDLLYGGKDDDVVKGGSGEDTLVGANGSSKQKDELTGGGDADLFVLGDSFQSFYEGKGKATINDFSWQEGDHIQLHGSASDYTFGINDSETKLKIKTTDGDLIAKVFGEGVSGFDVGLDVNFV